MSFTPPDSIRLNLGSNEVLAREGIDTFAFVVPNIISNFRSNEVLAREGIDTHMQLLHSIDDILSSNEVLAREGIDTFIISESKFIWKLNVEMRYQPERALTHHISWVSRMY